MNLSFLAGLALLIAAQTSALEKQFPIEFSAPAPDAQFRGIARDMYRSLGQPSCATKGFRVAKGFRRLDHLQDQIAAVKQFEARMIGTPLAAQLAIAKADSRLRYGCWADDDIWFAKTHVKMTQDDVGRSLSQLNRLAPSLARSHPLDAKLAPATQFRDLSRDAILLVRLRCPLIKNTDNQVVLSPARAALIDFRRRLDGTGFAAQFDIANADANFDFYGGIVECGPPRSVSVAEVQRAVLLKMDQKLSQLDSMVKQGGN